MFKYIYIIILYLQKNIKKIYLKRKKIYFLSLYVLWHYLLQVYICAWSFSGMNDICTYTIYFVNVWNVTNEEESNTIFLQKYLQKTFTEQCPSYRYCKLEDGTRVLKQILYESMIFDRN